MSEPVVIFVNRLLAIFFLCVRPQDLPASPPAACVPSHTQRQAYGLETFGRACLDFCLFFVFFSLSGVEPRSGYFSPELFSSSMPAGHPGGCRCRGGAPCFIYFLPTRTGRWSFMLGARPVPAVGCRARSRATAFAAICLARPPGDKPWIFGPCFICACADEATPRLV